MELEKERNRIRDNQRRSRARKKAYVADLENRLRECQLRGIEASAEVQQAARRVAEENQRLRKILSCDFGLSSTQIDERLKSHGLQTQVASSGMPRSMAALDKVMVSTRPDFLDMSKSFLPRDQQQNIRPALPHDRVSDSSAESYGAISSNAQQPPYGVDSGASMNIPPHPTYIQAAGYRLADHAHHQPSSIWPPSNPASPTDGLAMNMHGCGANQTLDFHHSFSGSDTTNSATNV